MRNNIERFEKKLMSLKCLSPVHVGGGEEAKLNKIQYIYDNENKRLHFIREKEWIEFLVKEKLFGDFVRFVEQWNKKIGLWNWLKGKKGGEFTIKGNEPYIASTANVEKPEITVRGKKKELNDVNCFIKNVRGRPFLPGSSIKGAIIMAVLHCRIKDNREYFTNKYWLKIKSAIEHRQRKERDKLIALIRDEIEQEILFKLDYKDENDRTIKKDSVVRSAAKGIVVGDAQVIFAKEQKTRTIIVAKEDFSTKKNEFALLPIYRECLPQGTTARFYLTIDKEITRTIGIENIDDIIKILAIWAEDVLTLEGGAFVNCADKDDIKNHIKEVFANSTDANCILGGGTGFFTKSLFYSLAPDFDDARKVLKGYGGFKDEHKHSALDMVISPRTLKIATANSKKSHIGLCKIEVKKEVEK